MLINYCCTEQKASFCFYEIIRSPTTEALKPITKPGQPSHFKTNYCDRSRRYSCWGVTCASTGPWQVHGALIRVCLCQVKRVSKLLSHYATNQDQVGFCRQVSTRHSCQRQGNFNLLCVDGALIVQTYLPTKNISVSLCLSWRNSGCQESQMRQVDSTTANGHSVPTNVGRRLSSFKRRRPQQGKSINHRQGRRKVFSIGTAKWKGVWGSSPGKFWNLRWLKPPNFNSCSSTQDTNQSGCHQNNCWFTSKFFWYMSLDVCELCEMKNVIEVFPATS